MKIIENPRIDTWKEILQRPVIETGALFGTVSKVLDDVRLNGDEALRRYELEFDHVSLEKLNVEDGEFYEAVNYIPEDLKKAIDVAYSNIHKFHSAQRFEEIKVETSPGVTCIQRSVPISKVGLYIPGGTAPLFSTVLMLAIPAKIAGCSEIVLCSPPDRNGKINPYILYAARIAGVTNVYKVGGAQAVAAMAYGTESVSKVDKIFGPGNQYVVAAKQLVSLSDVAIDMPAGPSEVEVLADESSNPSFVAADLLSQAEHGADSQVLLVSTERNMIDKVVVELEKQLEELPRKEIAAKSISHSQAIYVDNMETAISITNEYAPEHLILSVKNYNDIASKITNAGSVFLGQYACESAGDYASGTNHTLPTKAYAKAYSGLCLDSFMRKMTLQELTPQGIKSIGHAVELMAGAEGLDAHKNAMTLRLNSIKM
jgi:histidinol dehydrogenase